MLKRNLRRIINFIKSIFRRKKIISDDSYLAPYDKFSDYAKRRDDL